jgi:tubulin---tyrosine ligase
MAAPDTIYLNVDYEDAYVQPLLLAALKSRLPMELLIFVNEAENLPPLDGKLLQWRQYEEIDFEHLLEHPNTSLANSYVIRKALIRKHYLSTTVSHWLTKHPDSILGKHVKPSVEFEVDYAEFLDDALVEAFELKENWARNEGKEDGEREWWILKPGMSERGQGIRLFSSEEELTEIFEEWDPPSDDEDDEDGEVGQDSGDDAVNNATNPRRGLDSEETNNTNGVVTAQLRHFIAQTYIHPPLLLPAPHPSAGRKFHIRTYVLAVGALKLYVYKPMLALFAAKPYTAPSTNSISPNEDLGSHLTNTCLQTGEREGSVHAFWSLPDHIEGLDGDWRANVFDQICTTSAEVFEAAARTMSIHFQPLPNAFEIFGLDFLVDAEGTACLLEVNAFPDFAQTGAELRGLVRGLFEGVVDVAVAPFYGSDGKGEKESHMLKVLDIDLGRR